MIRNRFNYQYNQAYPLGYDNWTRTMYANKTLILNAVNYLCGDEDVLNLRSREVKLRKLNPSIRDKRLKYQLINILAPIVALVLAAGVIMLVRRLRNTKNKK